MEMRGSIKGVLKTNAGMPVSDAVIMIKEGSHEFNDIASVSNSDGEFYVSGIVIPGRYTLQVEHANGSFTKEINVTSADKVLSISF
jgi:Carboxypeptidase regulatory-like domain